MNLYLKEPTIEEMQKIVEMCKEFEESNDEYKFEGISNFKNITEENYNEFLQGLEKNKHIDEINSNWANQTTYVLIDENGHIYGAGNIRHELKGKLIEIGGHIGYAIRPSERGKGFGTKQLILLLEKTAKMGIEQALLTCRENNIGSAKTIEKCFGVKDESVPSMFPGIMESRYWIDVRYVLNQMSESIPTIK